MLKEPLLYSTVVTSKHLTGDLARRFGVKRKHLPVPLVKEVLAQHKLQVGDRYDAFNKQGEMHDRILQLPSGTLFSCGSLVRCGDKAAAQCMGKFLSKIADTSDDFLFITGLAGAWVYGRLDTKQELVKDFYINPNDYILPFKPRVSHV